VKDHRFTNIVWRSTDTRRALKKSPEKEQAKIKESNNELVLPPLSLNKNISMQEMQVASLSATMEDLSKMHTED